MPSNGDVLTWDTGETLNLSWAPPSAGTPASSVTSEILYGQSAAVGVGTDYARDDHTHGTPTNAFEAASAHEAGTGTWELWLAFGHGSNTAAATFVSPQANVIYAYPWVNTFEGLTLDRLGAYVTTTAAGKSCRLGIFQATGRASMYPGNLLVDSGALSIAVGGVISATISQALPLGTVLWFAVLGEATFGLKASAAGDQIACCGGPTSLNGQQLSYIYAAQAWGALPATFPAGATIAYSASRTLLFGRCSA